MHAEQGMGLGFEKVREVLAEDHGDAGQVSQSGHNAASLKLREEAGRKAGVATKLDQAHRLFQAEALDPLTNSLLSNKGFGGFRIDLNGDGFLADGGGGVVDRFHGCVLPSVLSFFIFKLQNVLMGLNRVHLSGISVRLNKYERMWMA
jgi:hypothetical protein